MIERLNRNEVPMQPINDRDQGISGTVPVFLGTDALAPDVMHGVLDIEEATRAVRDSYDEDMTSYLGYLREQGYDLPHLRGYEQFQDSWRLDAEPSDTTGLLELVWHEGDEEHRLRHDPIPVTFHNQHDKDGEFYTPETWTRMGIFPMVYRRVTDPVFLFAPPDRMKLFGVERPEMHAVIDLVAGIAEVAGTSFDSAYQDNLAKALLLRNFGVHYVNLLAAEIPDTP